MRFNLGSLHRVARVAIKQNGPLITSVAAGVGVGATAYLVGKASFRAYDKIHEEEVARSVEDIPPMTKEEKVKLVWREYIPAATAVGGTILFIAASHRLATSKALAAQAALAISERAYSEYREKIVEELGERKDQSVRDAVAQDRVRSNPPPKTAELLAEAPAGTVLYHEAYTGRYFMSSRDKLERAINKVNAKAIKFEYATLDDFYHEIGLRFTSMSGEIGWRGDRQVELLYSAVLIEDEDHPQRSAVSFEYSYTTPIP